MLAFDGICLNLFGTTGALLHIWWSGRWNRHRESGEGIVRRGLRLLFWLFTKRFFFNWINTFPVWFPFLIWSFATSPRSRRSRSPSPLRCQRSRLQFTQAGRQFSISFFPPFPRWITWSASHAPSTSLISLHPYFSRMRGSPQKWQWPSVLWNIANRAFWGNKE